MTGFPVYLVQGLGDEGDDHAVCAYTHQDRAQKFVDQLNLLGNQARQQSLEKSGHRCRWDETVSGKLLLSLDPNCTLGYSDLHYTWIEVQVRV